MKKIFSLIAVAALSAMAVSCEIEKHKIKPLDSNELADYSGKLFSNTVLLPVELAEVAIGIDEYLALPEEQKAENGRYVVRQLSDYVYQVSNWYMSCTVDTGGYSVWEERAEWKFLSFVAKTSLSSYDNGTWRTSLTDDVSLTFNADPMGEAKLKVKVEMPCGQARMSLMSREEGTSVWNLSAEGTDVGSDGLLAEYRTADKAGGISVTREEYAKSCRKTYQGVFYVDIYKNDSKIAWIEMNLYSDSDTQYVINRRPVS